MVEGLPPFDIIIGNAPNVQLTYNNTPVDLRPYFKVDVEFQAVGRPDRDENGRVTLVEDSQDLILKISRPYLQFSIMD